MSFPGQEALLTVYGTILAQHLALQRMTPAVQKLQPQLVAAALGEALPHRAVGRGHTLASAPREGTCPHCTRKPNPTATGALGAPHPHIVANETPAPPRLLFMFKTQHRVPRNCQAKTSGLSSLLKVTVG